MQSRYRPGAAPWAGATSTAQPLTQSTAAQATSNPTTRSTAATTRLPRRLATATNMPPPARIGRFRLVRFANALARLNQQSYRNRPKQDAQKRRDEKIG